MKNKKNGFARTPQMRLKSNMGHNADPRTLKRRTLNKFINQIRQLSGFMLITMLVSSGGVFAAPPTPAPDPCDPDYYESLKSRAWLEAQREITQNQNLIFKPDSVLEYTCFDKYLNALAQDGINMFSETQRWGVILQPTSLDSALQRMVGAAAQQYVQANFGHSFLGGRSGTDYSLQPVTPGGYSCDMMLKVWKEAKCMNFVPNPNEDGFYTFEQYRDNPDHRYLPTRCGSITSDWNQNIQDAYAGVPWTEDSVKTFLDKLDPANCNNTANKIETGLVVVRSTTQPVAYVEKVCIMPGCRYVPTGTGGTASAPQTGGNCQP
jgi:hypothetical protein